MSDVHEICRLHLEAAAAEAGPNVVGDVLGRAMLGQVLAAWRRERPLDDIRAELLADNLDPDEEYPLMRP